MSRFYRRLAAVALLVLGLAVSTVATSLAIAAGERPVTVLPFGAWLAAHGLVWLTLARVVSVAVLWIGVGRVAPERRAQALAVAGGCWLLWGVWQVWLLLART